jgi:membrane protease YdiL (CAAX protease family)
VARRLLLLEVGLVLALSLGRSGVYALVNLVAAATAPGALSSQKAVLNGSLAPGRPWLDLTYQLLALGFGVVPVLLVGYLLARSDDSPERLWSSGAVEHRRDALRGLLLAAVVGGTGLAFYLVTHAVGVDLTVVAEDLPHEWWRFPVLVLSALQNALLEEFVVVGYLVLRLRQAGASAQVAVGTSALVRGSYHLYQGLGGFFGNAAMGVLFGWLYTRWGRVTPLVVAHTVLDVVAFVGYAALAGKVSWLPT